jgi:hypothetical protein
MMNCCSLPLLSPQNRSSSRSNCSRSGVGMTFKGVQIEKSVFGPIRLFVPVTLSLHRNDFHHSIHAAFKHSSNCLCTSMKQQSASPLFGIRCLTRVTHAIRAQAPDYLDFPRIDYSAQLAQSSRVVFAPLERSPSPQTLVACVTIKSLHDAKVASRHCTVPGFSSRSVTQQRTPLSCTRCKFRRSRWVSEDLQSRREPGGTQGNHNS